MLFVQLSLVLNKRALSNFVPSVAEHTVSSRPLSSSSLLLRSSPPLLLPFPLSTSDATHPLTHVLYLHILSDTHAHTLAQTQRLAVNEGLCFFVCESDRLVKKTPQTLHTAGTDRERSLCNCRVWRSRYPRRHCGIFNTRWFG